MHHLHRPRGSAIDQDDPVLITPSSARWSYTGLRVVRLAPGAGRTLATTDNELVVLVLSGSCTVEVEGERVTLAGRQDVFSRVTDLVYVPRDSTLTLASGAGAEVALPMARASVRGAFARIEAESVPVEVRGAGHASRQVTNYYAAPGYAAERLVIVEVLTPGGNTSSYPPHKHDDASQAGEAELEEIYYYRFASGRAFGFHRTYAGDGSFDVTATVRDGDVFLVPRGYHGPCVALPDYDMYYLNVLAGPAPRPTLAFRDDPAHAWIRDGWAGQPVDPRVPVTSARGRVGTS
jgi:5-deoxy-glucuronate isomerase